jgi:molybdenum cofactor cytidylyltransferase
MSDIFAILMASGFSRRFGSENKLLVPFRGKPLARYTLDLVCGLNCFREIFFITACDQVAALAEDLPVRVIRNRSPEKGRRESIRLGVEAAITAAAIAAADNEKGSSYYVFFPCDQPLLDPETLKRILEARKPGCIVEPRCRGRPGNPCLFSDVFWEELLTLKEGEQAKVIKARHPNAIIPIEAPNPLAFADIDNLDDLNILENI